MLASVRKPRPWPWAQPWHVPSAYIPEARWHRIGGVRSPPRHGPRVGLRELMQGTTHLYLSGRDAGRRTAAYTVQERRTDEHGAERVVFRVRRK